MIILGIDPGSRIAGYGLVEKKGEKVTHIDNGIINVHGGLSLTARLVLLHDRVSQLIQEFSPDALSIENIFYAKNVGSTLKLAHARGAILVAAGLRQLPTFEYSPLEVKQAVVGYGRAGKEQIQQMVKNLLRLKQVAEENASDALAVALCHAHSEKLRALIRTG